MTLTFFVNPLHFFVHATRQLHLFAYLRPLLFQTLLTLIFLCTTLFWVGWVMGERIGVATLNETERGIHRSYLFLCFVLPWSLWPMRMAVPEFTSSLAVGKFFDNLILKIQVMGTGTATAVLITWYGFSYWLFVPAIFFVIFLITAYEVILEDNADDLK